LKHAGFRIKTYVEYRRRAVNQYGLHSPFLFEFYKACFGPAFKHSFPSISKLRSKLKRDKTEIQITDFGAGSLVYKSNNRRVSEMHASASVSKKQGEFLHRLVCYFKPKTILELGTHLGLSSAYMALASETEIVTLEGCPSTAEVASQNHRELDVENVKLKLGDFLDSLPEVLCKMKAVDMAYIDANHSYEGTMWNYEQISLNTEEHTVLIFDDINWSPDMKKAWDEIISKPEISLSINCYKFGLVFFRKGIEKQHFYFKF
jgi:predicted O-methyltransferase YrrM